LFVTLLTYATQNPFHSTNKIWIIKIRRGLFDLSAFSQIYKVVGKI
jgi:hypothetical protein